MDPGPPVGDEKQGGALSRRGAKGSGEPSQRNEHKGTRIAQILAAKPTLHVTYREAASQLGSTYGCANCRGVELLKGCLAYWVDLGKPEQLVRMVKKDNEIVKVDAATKELAELARAYSALVDEPFGGSSAEYYIQGIRLRATGKLSVQYSVRLQPWYEGLKNATKQKMKVNGQHKLLYSAVTSNSSKAHAVLARETLDIGFCYGLWEFVAALASPGLREETRVGIQSLKLAGGGDGTYLASVASKLPATYASYTTAKTAIAADVESQAAGTIVNDLTEKLAEVLLSDQIAAADKPAVLGGLCTLYRQLVLSISVRQRTMALAEADRGTTQKLATGLLDEISCVDDEDRKAAYTFLATNTRTRLGMGPELSRAILAVCPQWTTEGTVEFSHQCGVCEKLQGTADLSRRMVDYYLSVAVDRRVASPVYGVNFADLFPITSRKDAVATVWDLTNAVTVQAIDVFYKNLSDQVDKVEHLPLVKANLEAVPDLFITYMKILMLELTYCQPSEVRDRRVVKLLLPTGKT